MSAPTTFGVSTDETTKNAIQTNAAKHGLSLSAYVLSWLPEGNDPSRENERSRRSNGQRKRYARERSSSAL